MLHDSFFNMRKNFYDYSKLKDLGYLSEYTDEPDIVKACKARRHIPEEISLAHFIVEVRCWDCKYRYVKTVTWE